MRPGNQWTPLIITLAIQAMVAAAVLAVPAVAPRVAESLQVSATYVGLFVSVAYAAAIFASLASGTATGRYGSIRVSQASLVLCAVGLCLCTLASPWALALGAVFVGLGYGPITPASSHLLARTTPVHRIAFVFSVKQTGVPLGGVLAGAIVPGLQAVIGWRFAILGIALACLLCALLAQTLRKRFDVDRDASRRLAMGQLLEPVMLVMRHPSLRLLAISSFVFAFAQLALTAYAVTYLTSDMAYGLVAAGAVFAASQSGGVVGRVWWGYMSDRWLGARRMLTVLGALMSCSALATALLHPAVPGAVVVGVMFVFGASAIGWNGVYLSEVARVAPKDQAGVATGGTLAVTFLGNVIGPAVFGAVSGLFGSYRAGFLVVAIVVALCAVAIWRVKTVIRHRT
jgi:predicted MFS family arabinose efflux permease